MSVVTSMTSMSVEHKCYHTVHENSHIKRFCSLMQFIWLTKRERHKVSSSWVFSTAHAQDLIFWSFIVLSISFYLLRKEPTFRHINTGFPAKWRLRNERRNSILMTCHYPDLGSASDWLEICCIQSEALPRSGKDASSVWNFCACFSDVISRENQWWHRQMSAVFSGKFL